MKKRPMANIVLNLERLDSALLMGCDGKTRAATQFEGATAEGKLAKEMKIQVKYSL